MLADFLTKPLQGSLFRKFRDVILGYVHISTLKAPARPVSLVERVVGQGNDDIPGSVRDEVPRADPADSQATAVTAE